MTNDVHLRDVIESDLPIFYEQQLDPDATRMAAFPSRDREAFMKHWAKIMADETNTLKTILFAGQVAGNIVSWQQGDEREVGYWLGKEYWGKGIATRALAEFLNHVTTRPLYAQLAQPRLPASSGKVDSQSRGGRRRSHSKLEAYTQDKGLIAAHHSSAGIDVRPIRWS
jgi:RimJ/RimL family protein N-acetyltransferase